LAPPLTVMTKLATQDHLNKLNKTGLVHRLNPLALFRHNEGDCQRARSRGVNAFGQATHGPPILSRVKKLRPQPAAARLCLNGKERHASMSRRRTAIAGLKFLGVLILIIA
jgi:hypothetical protein